MIKLIIHLKTKEKQNLSGESIYLEKLKHFSITVLRAPPANLVAY